jgi:hypothetical protein
MKKMITAAIIDRVTVSGDYKIEIKSTLTQSQCSGGMTLAM